MIRDKQEGCVQCQTVGRPRTEALWTSWIGRIWTCSCTNSTESATKDDNANWPAHNATTSSHAACASMLVARRMCFATRHTILGQRKMFCGEFDDFGSTLNVGGASNMFAVRVRRSCGVSDDFWVDANSWWHVG
jgi:hypothetical protein